MKKNSKIFSILFLFVVTLLLPSCKSNSVIDEPHEPAADVRVMNQSDIKDFDKFYKPQDLADMNMLRSDTRWSWWRMKQSDHFFVFWEPGFDDNPNADSIPEVLRVDVDDLLQKAEKFYQTNVDKLHMATVGQGKSVLDKYKMEIYLLYQTEWLATGSGYDNVIGALWVNPSTCKPVGSTIGHEIGHSFQYQVSADKIATGEGQVTDYGANVGFRYGFGENGQGGCPYWEQCAQWQSFQDYPQEAFTQDANVQVWLKNHHRHFNHEWQRYASYWFQYYFMQKHGLDAYANIWKESKYPEDPLQTYMRLYCNNDLSTFYRDLYDYAAHCANYDFEAVHKYKTDAALNYSTKLYKVGKAYQVAYANCPGTTGFNLIPLNVPQSGTTVEATLTGLNPGSKLAAGDPGTMVDGDGKAKGTTATYNSQSNQSESFRYSFVAITKDDKSHYGTMKAGKSGVVSFKVPANTEKLYLCVLGAPSTYNRNPWDDDESTDEQWPYEVSFTNTDLLGNVTIPKGAPENVNCSLEGSFDASSTDYALKTFNLLNDGIMKQIAKAFKLQPSEIAGATLDDATVRTDGFVGPADGKIAIGLTNPDGSVSYAYSANGVGFWIDADGSASKWGAAPVYFEYNGGAYGLTVGHKPGATEKGKTYTFKPTLVYNKDGKLYKAVITVKMKF